MKKRIAYLSVLLLVVGVSFAIAAYTTIPNPGHGGETGVWIQNTNGQEYYLQNLVNDLSTLDCDGTINFDGYQSIPINFWGHTADQIKITIRGVDTTLQEAINNQWLAKDNPSCFFSVTPTSITGPFHDASQIEIFSPKGEEESLQKSIDERDFFDKCECTQPSIWLGSRNVGPSNNKGSNLLKVSTSDGSILQQYTICNNAGTYTSVGTILNSPPCSGSGNARYGVGWEDPDGANGGHNGFIAQNLEDNEIWYIVGKGVAHYREQSGQLNFIKYCTQPNGIYSVNLDATGDAWITTQPPPGGVLRIKKLSGGLGSDCSEIQNLNDPSNILNNIMNPEFAYPKVALTSGGDMWVLYVRGSDGFTPRLFYIQNPTSPTPIFTDLTTSSYTSPISLITDRQGNAYITGSLGSGTYVVNKYNISPPHTKEDYYIMADTKTPPYGLFGLAIDSSQRIWVGGRNLVRINDITINSPPLGTCPEDLLEPRLASVGVDKFGNVIGVTAGSYSDLFCTHNSDGSNQICKCNQMSTGRLVAVGDFTGMNRNVAL